MFELLQMEAESMGVDFDPDALPRGSLEALWTVNRRYSKALAAELQAFLRRENPDWPAEIVEAFTEQLFDEGHAGGVVYLTLVGSGAGIWDGRWDHFFEPRALERLHRQLTVALRSFADDTGGGALNDAMRDVVMEAQYARVMEETGGDVAATGAGYYDADEFRWSAPPGKKMLHNRRSRRNPMYGRAPLRAGERPMPGGPRMDDERAVLEKELLRAQDWRERREIRAALAELDRQEADRRYYSSLPNGGRRGRILAATTPAHTEYLPGGYAEGMYDEDFDPEQLAMGIEVELEHIDPQHPDAEAIAAEIARDHLREHPRYYDALLAAGL